MLEKDVRQDRAQTYDYLSDRIAIADKRLQRYGTPGQCTDKGTWKPYEVEDPEHLDERRAQLGMKPIAEMRCICGAATVPNSRPISQFQAWTAVFRVFL